MTAFAHQSPAPTGGKRSLGLLRLVLAFFTVLLLTLLLNGGLTLGALHNVQLESSSAAARIVGHDWALRVQGAIRFGKPIEHFYGLDATLAEIHDDLPVVATVAVTDAAGQVLRARGEPPVARELAEAVARTLPAGAETQSKLGARYYLVFPIQGRDGGAAGTLAMVIHEATIAAALRDHLEHNLQILALVTLAASVCLLVGVLAFNPLRGVRPPSGWRLYALPLAVMLLAQGAYTWHSIDTFRAQYLGTVQATTEISIARLARDLNRLFDQGVKIDRLVGIEQPFQRIMDRVPEISFMEISAVRAETLYRDAWMEDRVWERLMTRAAPAEVLYRVYRDGRLERQPESIPLHPTFDLTAELLRPVDAEQRQLGSLRLRLEERAIAAGVRQRLLDSGTVALVSALFVVELFMLLAVLVRPRSAPAARPAAAQPASSIDLHLFGRPTAFLLLFAWALPLSFIPLRTRELYTPLAGLSETVTLALPLSAEMLCALIAVLLAGVLTDRRGWQLPFIIGVGITVAGALLSMWAGDVGSFILARAVVGTGYGLAWMGIQGFIFLLAPPRTVARGIAHLVAGIFAGYICGSAVGAMLAQQFGYVPVFGVSAMLSLLPGAFVLLFMRRYFGKPAVADPAAVPPSRSLDWASVGPLLRDRRFFWLQMGSVIPFSVAQVGLLYFALPLYLSDEGVAQATIGRILMLYGLTVIYIGPLLGHLIDASPRKKPFIVLGGLIGSGGLIYLYFDSSLFAVMLSVFALGVASSLAGAAQSAFALNLQAVLRAGVGKAMSLQRAADKFGQMIGPLLVGALFASVGTASGLAATGLLYLVATLLFLIMAYATDETRTSQRIPFLHSIKTRIFLAVTLVLTVVAGVVMSASRHALERDMLIAEERSIQNVLTLVEANIRGRFRTLLQDKVAIVQAGKQRFRDFEDVVRATLDQFAGLAERRLIAHATARALAVQWLSGVQVDGGFLLVFDRDQRVLVSPDASQIGRPLDGIEDLKGRNIALAARDEVASYNHTFLSFAWPDAAGGASSKFGSFIGYPRWDWVIGMVGDVGRVEVEAQRQRAQLRAELAATLPHITTSGNAAVFVLDSQGNLMAPPENPTYLAVLTAEARGAFVRLTADSAPLRLTTAAGEELEGRATYIRPFDWHVAVLASRDAMREPAHRLIADQARIFLGALAVGLILAYFFAYRIALPLDRLSTHAMKLPETDFASEQSGSSTDGLPVRRRDEIGRLAQAFVFMEDSLHANVRQLMQAVAARERMEGELTVARDIQMDLLPKVFPAFPERDEIAIHALLAPARQVGGDLYDFYFLDEHRLCFAVGDVSDKGVPAALFMTITMTLIHMASQREVDPSGIMSEVNEALSRDNPNCMFVTLIVGVLDVRTGRAVYANAGHNPPLVLRQQGTVDVLMARGGPAVGVVQGMPFTVLETRLAPGDCLVLYTDGVTEAMNPAGEWYGDERLRQLLGDCAELTPGLIVRRIADDVRDHAGEAEQSDDLTVLAIRYRGGADRLGAVPRLELQGQHAHADQIRAVDAFVAARDYRPDSQQPTNQTRARSPAR